MGKDSKIEWTHHTFNPWWGCVEMSPACDHCYARTFAKRVGYDIWGTETPRRWFGTKHWTEPLKWNAAAEKSGERQRVFCASMADVFERHARNGDLDAQRANLWALIESTPMLDWLLLTKRPENIRSMVPASWLDHPRANVWYGTTVEDRPRTARVDRLRQVPAKVRFLSCEPLLDDVTADLDLTGIHWVIAGGESGPGARPMRPEWASGLSALCSTNRIAFHFKQWGDYNERGERVGKKAAGRLLNGREWNELPFGERATVPVVAGLGAVEGD